MSVINQNKMNKSLLLHNFIMMTYTPDLPKNKNKKYRFCPPAVLIFPVRLFHYSEEN